MAHIVEFEIEGLAGRSEKYGRKLNRDVNIFFGLNGSGKTSLLKILHSALSTDTEILENVPFTAAEVKIHSVNYKQTFTHTLKKDLPKKSQKERLEETTTRISLPEQANWLLDQQFYFRTREPSLKWAVSPAPREPKTGWQHGYLPTSRLYTPVGRLARTVSSTGTTPLSEEQLDAYFASIVSSLWAGYSANVLSVVRQAQEQALANILKAVLVTGKDQPASGVLDPEIAYRRISDFLHRQGSKTDVGSPEEFAKRYQENRNLQAVANYIDRVEGRIEQATKARTDLQDLIGRMFSGQKAVQFGDTAIEVRSAANEPIKLASLSSGEKHLLRVFIETIIVRTSSIIIDEPEISMHVDWQKVLVKALQQLNPQAQFILATHSPEIMADVPDEKIFRL